MMHISAQDFCCRRSAGSKFEQLNGQWFPTANPQTFCTNAGQFYNCVSTACVAKGSKCP
jgi:hypothetical protein